MRKLVVTLALASVSLTSAAYAASPVRISDAYAKRLVLKAIPHANKAYRVTWIYPQLSTDKAQYFRMEIPGTWQRAYDGAVNLSKDSRAPKGTQRVYLNHQNSTL